MSNFCIGDNVKFRHSLFFPSYSPPYFNYGVITYIIKTGTITDKYIVKSKDEQEHVVDSFDIFEDDRPISKLKGKIANLKENDNYMKTCKNSEEKELKKDVEILLNLYIQGRKMNSKEIKRFSNRHFDIIEKQNAKNILKKVK